MASAGTYTGIKKDQIKKIHTLKSKLKMSDDDYRSAVQDIHGFSMTSKDLSFDEADRLIKRLEQDAIKKGVWKPYSRQKKYEELNGRKGMASPAQLRMIEGMWKNVSYTHDPAKQQSALRKFIFRIAGVQDLRFLTSHDVRKVIEALKSMRKKGGHHEIKQRKSMH